MNPILDITEHEIPLKCVDIFKNNKKTALEIGFGEGEFLIELAKRQSTWNYLGIEVKYGRFKKAARKARKANTDNVKLIHMDAEIAVEQVFSPKIFHKIYINFPDPWPKDRHKKHRIINDKFINQLLRIMKKNATIEFVSDYSEYVHKALNCFESNEKLSNTIEHPGYLNSVKERPLTRFEREFFEKKKTIFYLSFKKSN